MKITGIFETREVLVNGKLLDPGPSLKVWCHSPSGFNWGYEGSGPAQLALAILLLVTNNDIAARLHQDFKREVIARLPQTDFEIRIDPKHWLLQRFNVLSLRRPPEVRRA